MKLFLQFFAAAALCVAAASCTKDTIVPVEDNLETFSDLGVSERGDSLVIAFKDLPAAAQKLLLEKTDTSKIVRILKITLPDGKVNYIVRMEGRHGLRFDADGKLILHGHGHRGPKGGKHDRDSLHHHGTKITFKDLPAVTQKYLLEKSDTSKIAHIVKVTLPDGKVQYVVVLKDRKVLRFDANGALLAAPVGTPTLMDIKVTDLPAAAQKVLTDKKLTDKVQKVVKITLHDGKVFYTVEVKGGRPLFFDARGKQVNDIPGKPGGHRRPR